MVSGIAAAAAGQNQTGINLASTAGGNAAQNNFNLHDLANLFRKSIHGAPIETTGTDFAALAAYVQGSLNNDPALQNVASQAMSENTQNNVNTLAILMTRGSSGVAAEGGAGANSEIAAIGAATTGKTSLGWPGTGGAGPVPGTIGITDQTSVAALRNYYPKGGGVEFVYDPATNTFVTGRPTTDLFAGSPHEQLAQSINDGDSQVVGGTLQRGANGEFITTENSGHYGQNWTDANRQQFQTWLSNRVGISGFLCARPS